MRVVGAVGAVAHDHHQRREVLGQAEVGEEAGDALGLLGVGEAWRGASGVAGAVGSAALRSSRVGTTRSKALRSATLMRPSAPGASERSSRPASAAGAASALSSGAAGEAAARDLVQAILPAQAAGMAAAVFGRRAVSADFFDTGHFMHVVRRDDDRRHHRAQRCRLAVVEAVVVLEHGEVRGAAQGFELRIHFLEVAAHAFLAVVHAEHQLRGRAVLRGRCQRPWLAARPAKICSR